MCLYPRLIKNPKYLPNKKNGGYVPVPSDSRALWVPIGCGECIECKQKKSREWRARLTEEFKVNKTCSFVTLTFNEKKLEKYRYLAQEELQDCNKSYCDIYETDNTAAKIAVRHMLERYRKKTGKSIKHWLITERGHKNTRRIHIHGILWTTFEQEGRGKNGERDLNELWKNGWCFNGDYVGNRTITYISKYITKHDTENEGFHGKIMTSPGIGAGYIKSRSAKRNTYQGKNTCSTYQLPNGKEIDLCTYYRNKIYTEKEREKLWMYLLDKNERWVLGVKTDISLGEERYENLVNIGRAVSKNAGYQKPEWANKEYQKKYIQDRILLSQNKSVILQINFKTNKDGKEETNWNSGSENENVRLGHETQNGRNDLHSTGGLFTNESLRNGEIPNGRLRDATERYRSINRWNPNREMANHMGWSESKNNHIENQIINMDKSSPDSYIKIGKMDNKSTYECIDIETGEIFAGGLKDKNYKTLYYEKRSRKITQPDGSKRKIWKTIRYVQRAKNEQFRLFE